MGYLLTTWLKVLVIICSSQRFVLGDFRSVGVNYGTLGLDLPQAEDVVNMFHQYNIGKMRIFSPDQSILEALNASRQGGDDCTIDLYMGTTNKDIAPLAGDIDYARTWVQTHVVPYFKVCFVYITVGNEAIPGPDGVFIAPAIRNLRVALDAEGFPGITVSTVVPATVLGVSFPPSMGAFSNETAKNMTAILKEIAIYDDDSYLQKLMINVYPYFAYAADPVNVPLPYAQFTAKDPVMDGDVEYYDMFDAIVDAFYSAMEKVGFPTVGLTVSETGWPSFGNDEKFTSVELARTYNTNLKRRIEGGATSVGTPKRPNYKHQAFVFAMFDEDQKPEGVERYFGLFYGDDYKPKYPFF